MALRCEDLSQHGAVLIPPSSPKHREPAEDVLRRVSRPVPGAPPFPPSISEAHDRALLPVLVNRAAAPIALIKTVWTSEQANGARSVHAIGNGINPSVVLPFGLRPDLLQLCGYWQTILPGSKRLLTPSGDLVGDYTDVRPPAPDETWTGGGAGRSGGGISPEWASAARYPYPGCRLLR